MFSASTLSVFFRFFCFPRTFSPVCPGPPSRSLKTSMRLISLETRCLNHPSKIYRNNKSITLEAVDVTEQEVIWSIIQHDLLCLQVPEVTPSVAPILHTLSVLRLGSNRLRSLSDGSFAACPALTELYLQNNVISSLTDRTFCKLSKLEVRVFSS